MYHDLEMVAQADHLPCPTPAPFLFCLVPWPHLLPLLFCEPHFPVASMWLHCPNPLSHFNPHPRICLLILERGGRREERERKRNIDVREKYRLFSSHLCPNWGLNPQPFGVRDNTQATEPPGLGSTVSLYVMLFR